MRRIRSGINPDIRNKLERIQENLRHELFNIDVMIRDRTSKDGLSDFDWLRLHNAIENAIEVYDDVLNPEQ